MSVLGPVKFVIKNFRVSKTLNLTWLGSHDISSSTSDVRRYNRHKKIHDDEKQYRCETCNKGFNERADLNRHIERHIKSHEVLQEDNFNCPECHMSFRVQTDLQIHQSVHRNDGKLVCGECNKEFSSK